MKDKSHNATYSYTQAVPFKFLRDGKELCRICDKHGNPPEMPDVAGKCILCRAEKLEAVADAARPVAADGMAHPRGPTLAEGVLHEALKALEE